MRAMLCMICLSALAGAVWAEPPCACTARPVLPRVRAFDLTKWSSQDWIPVREERFPKAGEWVAGAQGITNDIPTGSEEKDIVAMKDGLGFACSVLDGLVLGDCTVQCEMAFERKGAPGIQLRMQLKDGNVAGELLSVVLYEKGLNVWRFDGEKWHKAAFAEFPVTEKQMHLVQATLAGPEMTVWVDGKRVIKSDDIGLDKPGHIGLWAGEGPCVFKSLRVRFTTS